MKETNNKLAQFFAGSSRRNFLTASAALFGTGCAATRLIGQSSTGVTGPATAPPPSELDVANYALTLEFLEATFYTQYVGPSATMPSGFVGTVMGNPPAFTAADFTASTKLSAFGTSITSKAMQYFTAIRDHEQAHVGAILSVIQAAGGTPVSPCTYTFPVKTVDDFITVGQALENVGVSAYDGAIGFLHTPAVLTAAATIATVEARHASYLNLLNGTSPFPGAFDTTRTMQDVLQIAAPFITSCTVPLQQTVAVVTPNIMTTNQPQITLDASGSTSASGPLTYLYMVQSGGKVPAVLQTSSSPKATIQFVNGAGTYLLQLIITDQSGKTSTQNISLTYQP